MRSLDMQAAALDALRSRSATLFAVTSLVATLLGGETLKKNGLHGPAIWCAIVALALSCIATLLVLWPWRWWQARIDGTYVIEKWVSKNDPAVKPLAVTGKSMNYVLDRCTKAASKKYLSNDKRVARLEKMYQISAVLVIVQIVAWLVAL
ncbi:hypothetical protein [Streptomyces sp. NPDC059649]|uniref:hypothetical protein n=1 Tax=Streptomyces sp. NPDC059649 TaxID=3346895 RepID=UPI0036C25C99